MPMRLKETGLNLDKNKLEALGIVDAEKFKQEFPDAFLDGYSKQQTLRRLYLMRSALEKVDQVLRIRGGSRIDSFPSSTPEEKELFKEMLHFIIERSEHGFSFKITTEGHEGLFYVTP